MKTILAIALASVCFCATAHAATMPKQLLGEWCYDPVSTESVSYYRRGKCEDDGGIEVYRTGYQALEIGCVLNRIKKAGRDYILTTICGEMDNHQFLGTERWRIQNNKLTTFTLGDSIDLDEPRPVRVENVSGGGIMRDQNTERFSKD